MEDFEVIYENVGLSDVADSAAAQRLNERQDEGKDRKQKGHQSLVLMMASLGLICVLLLVFIIWLIFRVQEFNHTVNSLQTKCIDFQILKNQEYETRVDALRAEKQQLQQKIQELESKVTSLSDDLKKKAWFFMTNEAKSWSESRQFCRARGADLVMIKTEEKQKFLTSVVKDRMWIGLTDKDIEGTMKWVDNSPLKQNSWMLGKPNSYGGNEDCVEMRISSGSPPLNNWNDASCSEMKKGICEK